MNLPAQHQLHLAAVSTLSSASISMNISITVAKFSLLELLLSAHTHIRAMADLEFDCLNVNLISLTAHFAGTWQPEQALAY